MDESSSQAPSDLPGEKPVHVRRVRYKGTHPRHFGEKYKELDPERYTEDLQKVMSRGQTPAGMHRPICVAEILQALALKPGMVGVDCTFGYGGHASEMLAQIVPSGKLYALDVDPVELPRSEARLRAKGFGEDVLQVRRINFAGLPKVMAEHGAPFDFILADLGVSSMQIDTPSRGFSYKVDGPLDLRLNPERGLPASTWLRAQSAEKLERYLRENADEPNALLLSRAIVEAAKPDGIATTTRLREVIDQALGSKDKQEVKDTCQRVFQVIRIAINEEFVVLDQLLHHLPACLAPGGRVAILTFHSGEDRRVKHSFRDLFRSGVYREISPDPIRPSAQERHDNPRSSSAKLRWAVRGSDK